MHSTYWTIDVTFKWSTAFCWNKTSVMERRRAMAEEPLFLQTSMEYLRQKVDTLGVRFQQILGRTPSTKSQYRPTNLEKFNKKHIRSISVVVYLLFVCIFALCAGIYYYRFWKPPKNLPRILTRNITRTILSSDWRIPTCVPWNTNGTSYFGQRKTNPTTLQWEAMKSDVALREWQIANRCESSNMFEYMVL